MSLNVALLGSGIFIREEHLPAVLACKDITLKAIYSRSQKSAKSLDSKPEVDIYSDDSGLGKSLGDLLARSDIHAVIIALPIKNQAGYVRKALQAGKHVLSEKPIAENVAEALDLISFYESEVLPNGVTWAVAENVRFWATALRAGEARQGMGRALTFRFKRGAMVDAGGKYFETEWRKNSTHQGGFLLDGGVHDVAALRLLLGRDDPMTKVGAFTAQLQPHLAPVDTIEAIVKSKSGAVGTLFISFGTTAKGNECLIACERGVVSKGRDNVSVAGKEEKVQDEGSGVAPEVRCWATGILNKKQDPRQSPREALADLEVIEACLRSGEQDGKVIELKHQEV